MSVITKVFILLVGVWFIQPTLVHAEELWPSTFDVSIQAGAEGVAELLLVNDSAEDATYSIDLLHVQTSEAHEDLAFSPLEMSWITLDDDVLSLSANTQGTIGLSFAPPEETAPQVLTVGVQVTRLDSSVDTVGVQVAIVALGFVTVGSVDEAVVWSDSTIEATSGWSLPVTHSLTVRNEGERVVIPQGTMRVTRLFGREVAVEEINPGGLRVLSGQTRTFTTQWGTVQNDSFSPWTIGIFDVEVTVQPWGEGDAFHARQRIVVFPWKGAIILLVVVVLIAWMHRFSRGPT